MSYLDPPTWVAGNPLPASDLNSYVRDNFRWLAGTAGRGTSLPGSPADGNVYKYIADDTLGIEWSLVYDASQAKWRYVGGPPLYAAVATEHSTSSTSYTDLASAGPSVTVPLAGAYNIEYHASVRGTAGATNDYYASPKLGAAATADADSDQWKTVGPADQDQSVGSLHRRIGPKVLAASDIVKLQYKVGTGTAFYKNRDLYVTPVYVS